MAQRDPVAGAASAPASAAGTPMSLGATLDAALEDALALTASPIGYLFLYDEDARQFTLHAWSREAMEECTIADPARVYDLDRTGLWGDVVRQRAPVLVNDLDAPNPGKRGYPEGHARLRRFLSIPVWDGAHIVAVVGVANKKAPYDAVDVRRLDALMRGMWPTAQRLASDEQHRKLSAIVEQSPAAIATCDASGRIDYVNRRFVEWLGVGRERLLGRHLQDVNPAQADDPAVFWEWLRAGGTWEREVRLGGGGRARYARVAASPLRSAAGVVTQFAIVAEDVTDRRELEAQLQHAQRLEAIGALAGGIAHDFNNVLAAAIALASAARAELPPDHVVRADLDELLGVLGRATGLTRTLLTFGRRTSTALRPERLGEIVAAVGRIARAGLRSDVALEVRAPDDGLVVEVDRGQLEQVLVNLVNNARDALPDGGRIVLSAAAVEVDAAQAARHLAAPGPYAVLGVEDTGVGMDDATLARIFEPFFTTKEAGKGTGLGLSMSHGIVRAHRGFIEVRSAPGQGARFDVYLPRRRSAAAARAGDGAAAPPDPVPPDELRPAARLELDASRGAGA